MITLHNSQLSLSISEVGAEIHSLRNLVTNTEYIYTGEAWKRHTPLLFPVTGPLKNGTIQAKGKSFTMPVNGFARDLEFGLLMTTENKATFVLNSDESTQTFFPFDFTLFVTHTLHESGYTSSVEIHAREELWCTFGWHPAFNLFMNGEDAQLESYRIEFDQDETADRLYPVNGIFSVQPRFMDKTKTLSLSRALTDTGPTVLNTLKSHSVTLRSTAGAHGITVERGDLPTLVIWTKEHEKAPFICIEPMYSFQDASRTSEISEMEGMMHLYAGQKRSYSNSFTCF
ncbi:Protein LacX, plasmid [bioreactor metagenome]|uniref:Protein LacX, plasmid n=1 Tax=bioreactor metagenome TaxID=1076179 RepID=A0A644ZQ42_9ZZZZ